jgi:hypothetical protein
MASVIKLPTHLWEFFSHAMNKAAQMVLGKFPGVPGVQCNEKKPKVENLVRLSLKY